MEIPYALKTILQVSAELDIIGLRRFLSLQSPWNYGWDNPKDEYAKYRQQQVDTVNILSPVQAENITDTLGTSKPDEPSYIE